MNIPVLALTFPTTSSFAVGLFVPIPTLVFVVGILGSILELPPVPVLICAFKVAFQKPIW